MRDKLGQYFSPEKSVCKVTSSDDVIQGKKKSCKTSIQRERANDKMFELRERGRERECENENYVR